MYWFGSGCFYFLQHFQFTFCGYMYIRGVHGPFHPKRDLPATPAKHSRLTPKSPARDGGSTAKKYKYILLKISRPQRREYSPNMKVSPAQGPARIGGSTWKLEYAKISPAKVPPVWVGVHENRPEYTKIRSQRFKINVLVRCGAFN